MLSISRWDNIAILNSSPKYCDLASMSDITTSGLPEAIIFPFERTLQPKDDSFNNGLIGIPHRVGSECELSWAP